VPFCTACHSYSFSPVVASVTTCSSCGVPSCWRPPTTVSYATTGLPSAAQITLRGARSTSGLSAFSAFAADSACCPAFAAGTAAAVVAGFTAGRVALDDEVAAEDGQPVVGAFVADVHGAVAVLQDVTDDQLLLGAQADLPGGLRLGGVGLADQFGALGGGERDRFGARLRRALGGGDLLGRGGGRAGLDGRRDQGGDPGESDGGGAAGGASVGRPASQH